MLRSLHDLTMEAEGVGELGPSWVPVGSQLGPFDTKTCLVGRDARRNGGHGKAGSAASLNWAQRGRMVGCNSSFFEFSLKGSLS